MFPRCHKVVRLNFSFGTHLPLLTTHKLFLMVGESMGSFRHPKTLFVGVTNAFSKGRCPVSFFCAAGGVRAYKVPTGANHPPSLPSFPGYPLLFRPPENLCPKSFLICLHYGRFGPSSCPIGDFVGFPLLPC